MPAKKPERAAESAFGRSVSSAIFWHFARKIAPWLAVIAVYLVVATLVVRWAMAREGEPTVDFGAEL
ncbi:hypothetical protein BH11MYX4_BH11MYX4_31940 [soil metagenome]